MYLAMGVPKLKTPRKSILTGSNNLFLLFRLVLKSPLKP